MTVESNQAKRLAVTTRDVKVMASALVGVRPFPAVVEQVRIVARDPSAAASDVARLVEQDVGIATNLLRVANAPATGLAQRCTSVRHAVSLLGTMRVAQVAAAAAALAFIESATDAHPAIGFHALAVAGVAQLLAPIIAVSPDEAFTLGLLHDVGAMLALQTGDPFYEGLIEQLSAGEEPSVEEETALMGFDHGALGGEVLRQWRVPAPLPDAIELHHKWEAALEAGGLVAAMVALLRVSEKIAAVLETTPDPTLDDLKALFVEPAFEHLGISPEEIHRMWPVMRASLTTAFVVDTDGSDDVSTVRRTRRSLGPQGAMSSGGAALAARPTTTGAATAPAPSSPDSRLTLWLLLGVLALAALGIAVVVVLF